MATRVYFLNISLSETQLKAFYAGTVSYVQAVSECGLRVRFPLKHLRPFVTKDGVSGRFRLEVEDGNHFLSLTRVLP